MSENTAKIQEDFLRLKSEVARLQEENAKLKSVNAELLSSLEWHSTAADPNEHKPTSGN